MSEPLFVKVPSMGIGTVPEKELVTSDNVLVSKLLPKLIVTELITEANVAEKLAEIAMGV